MFKDAESFTCFDSNYGENVDPFHSSYSHGSSCSQQLSKHVQSHPPSFHSGDEGGSSSPSSSFHSDSRGFVSPIDKAGDIMTSPNSGKGVLCFGCGHPILARYYVLAMERHFHNQCLKCHLCHAVLSEEPTCFEKDGRILCKVDYQRLYNEASTKSKRCARCTNCIKANDLVMKVRDFAYHVDCFICTICHRPFSRGDHFRMQSTDLFCRLHYDIADTFTPSEESDPLERPGGKADCANPKRGRPPKRKLLGRHGDLDPGYFHPAKPPSLGLPNPNADFNPIMESSMMGFNMTSMPHSHNGSNGVDMTIPLCPDGTTPTHQKGKRMRTTFKHNQLRIMKTYFAINPNPDAKDLKQLSQKTGLCKRVLQVWFQNSRAKSRRVNQNSGSDPGLSSNATLHLDESQEWSSSPPPSLQASDINSSLHLPLIQG